MTLSTHAMAHSDDDLANLSAFMNSQEFMTSMISVDLLRQSSTREQLGITSLDVILLVANYMETKGLDGSSFRPAWVVRLDQVAVS